MHDENLTRSPCLHRSGTHDLQTAESRYNFFQVLISCVFKCDEARKDDDAVCAQDLHRAGAEVQQHCCVHGAVAAHAIPASCEDLVAEENITFHPMRAEKNLPLCLNMICFGTSSSTERRKSACGKTRTGSKSWEGRKEGSKEERKK